MNNLLFVLGYMNIYYTADPDIILTRGCLLFLLGGRGRSPSHEDVMPIWHSPVSRPDTNLQHVTLEQTFPHCDNQEWSGFEPGQPERERGKVEHFVHSPMTRSTKDQHTQRVLSCQPDALLAIMIEMFPVFTSLSSGQTQPSPDLLMFSRLITWQSEQSRNSW